MTARVKTVQILCILFVVCIGGHRSDASEVNEEINAIVATEMDQQDIPGLSIAIIKSDMILLARGYGKSNLSEKTKATSKTVYAIGSMTKPFTAAAILFLEKDGRLALNTAISRYLPGMPEEWSSVTVHHLLTHTSGILEETYPGGVVRFDKKTHEQKNTIRKSFGPLMFPCGEQFSYSNIGYRLLGMIIESVSGETYWKYLNDHFFRPLGMHSTGNSNVRFVREDIATGYAKRWWGYMTRAPITPSSAFSAGALMSSVDDLIKWDRSLSHGKILKPSMIEKMWMPFTLKDGSTTGYGLGWYISKRNGYKLVEHSGGVPGFSSVVSKYPAINLTIILLTNREDANLRRIVNPVADLFL